MVEVDLQRKINALNDFVKNTQTEFKSLKGFEIILDYMIKQGYDLFGRAAILSMLYQTGYGAGMSLSKRIMEREGTDKVKPSKAISLLFKENLDYYSVMFKDIRHEQSEDGKYDLLIFTISNRCFYIHAIEGRDLKRGGSLCRINKGYFESALKEMTQLKKVEVNYRDYDESIDACIEEIAFYIPKA